MDASILFIKRRLKPERMLRAIDWAQLIFFASPFVVTHSLNISGLMIKIFTTAIISLTKDIWWFSGSAVILRNLVSNVRDVLLFKLFVSSMHDVQTSWLVL